MADFLKPKETPVLPKEQAPIPDLAKKPVAPLESKEQELAPEQTQTVEEQGETPQAAPSQQAQTGQHISTLQERVATPHTKSERLVEIERIMGDGLEDIYNNLEPQVQQTVKAEGEKAANEIEGIIEQGKAVAKKVLSILRGWLEKIPGVNNFFLEQESKLKTDKIMAITRKTRH
jgi:hypothetical protein